MLRGNTGNVTEVASAGADETGSSDDTSTSNAGSASSGSGSGAAAEGSADGAGTGGSASGTNTTDSQSAEDGSGADAASTGGSSASASSDGSGTDSSQQDEGREPFDLYESEKIASDFHKKHKGEIVFSDSPLPEDPDPGQVKSSFSLNDKLYARSFLEDSAVNLMRKRGFKQMAGIGKIYMEVKPVSWPDDKWIRSENTKELNYKTAAGREKTVIQFQGGSYLDQDSNQAYLINGDAPPGFKFFVGRLLPRLPKGDSVEVEMRLVYYFLKVEENPYGSVDDFTQTLAEGTIELKNVTSKARAKLYHDHGPKLPDSEHPKARRLEPETLERVEEEWGG